MRAILLFMCALIPLFSFGGTIKGTITDKQTGEPLIGAIVMLDGTDHGTSTGLDGSYTLQNIATGKYELKVKYSSYETAGKTITISADETQKLDIALSSKSSLLKEVEIKSKYKNGSDEQARSQEKNSDNILNIMSARTIELLPDIQVANVLQRVSGIQVQRDNNGDARYVTIRGMDKRYNYTTVDGVKIPSPDDVGRYVPLDIFPAELVERIEVIKALLPSMEGDAIGGVTNLVMKKAPDHLVVYASAATGYNENSFDEHYNSWDKSALAMHTPASIHGATYNAGFSDLPLNTSIIKPVQTPANDLFSLSIGDRFGKKKKLGVMLSGSYQNTFKIANNTFFKPASQPDVSNVPEFDDLDLRKYSTQETRIGVHANVDYRINDKNTIDVYGLFVQLNRWEERNVIDSVITAVNRPGPGLGEVDYKDRTTFIQQRLKNLSLRGEHQITDRFKVDWIGNIAHATRDMPDQTEFSTMNNFSINPTTGGIFQQGNIIKSGSKIWETTNDQNVQGFLNLTYTPNLFGKDIEFKGGVMDRTKSRNNYYNEYDLNPVGVVPYNNIQTINPSNITIQDPTGDLGIGDYAYTVKENVWAYYAQAKFNSFNNKLQTILGVRVENTYFQDSAYVDPHAAPYVDNSYKYKDVLPSINFKYALNSKTNLRLDYYESIARPNFYEIVGTNVMQEDFDNSGNVFLKHSVAQNIDARYEFFPKGIDQVLIGVFYKNISDAIENYLTRPTGPSAQVMQAENDSNNAINYGVEIQATKYFHYFGVSGNYTYTHSSVPVTVLFLEPSANGEVNKSVIVNRPLQGQAANIGNLSLLYKNPVMGLDVQFTYQYTGRHIYLASGYEGLDYWQKGTSFFDFSFEKRIVKRLSVYAKVNNLLNTKAIVELDYSNKRFKDPANPTIELPDQNLKDGKTLVESFDYGRNYLVGIRYKFD